MDLERLGAPELAREFVNRFVEFAGDPCPPSLIHHYIAYRAVMRAKIAAIRCEQGDVTAAEQARRLAAIGLRHLRLGRPTLVLVGGLPGTGKTTIAAGTRRRPGVRRDPLRPDPQGDRGTRSQPPRSGSPGPVLGRHDRTDVPGHARSSWPAAAAGRVRAPRRHLAVELRPAPALVPSLPAPAPRSASFGAARRRPSPTGGSRNASSPPRTPPT